MTKVEGSIQTPKRDDSEAVKGLVLFKVVKHFLYFLDSFHQMISSAGQIYRFAVSGKYFPGIKQLISKEQLT